jgi:hypothetical protein
MAQRFGVGIGIAAVVYLAMVVYADWRELRAAVAGFRWSLAIPVLGLSLVNYFLRFLRWEIYLRRSDVRVGASLSMRIFFSGLVMSVTPGKFGELLKAYLVKMHTGAPVSRTGPSRSTSAPNRTANQSVAMRTRNVAASRAPRPVRRGAHSAVETPW